jgi:hypothetical protein
MDNRTEYNVQLGLANILGSAVELESMMPQEEGDARTIVRNIQREARRLLHIMNAPEGWPTS